jgi:hypothetical protein
MGRGVAGMIGRSREIVISTARDRDFISYDTAGE